MRKRAPADPNLPPIPWRILGVVLLGTFLGPFGGMIVGFALPSIAKDPNFGVDLQTVKWVTLVFWLVTTFLVPITGFLGRRFGEARMFIAGFMVDMLGTLLSGLSHTFPLLIASRVVQGFGSAIMFALFGALITRTVPPQRRGVAFGLAGAVVAVSVTLAPVLGGLVLGSVGWRGVFFMQLPVHVLGIVLGLRVLPRDPIGKAQPFPWLSALSWLVLTAGLVFTAEAYSHGLWIEQVGWLIAATAFGLAVFLYCELKLAPLFNYALFRIPAIRLAASGALLMNISLFAMMLLLPFYFEDYLKFSPEKMGMYLSLGPLTTLLLAVYSGSLSDRRGFRLPILAGLSCSVLGFAALALGMSGSQWLVAAGIVLIGATGGLFNTPATSAMMGSAGDVLRAQTSSLGSLVRNLGFMGGTALGSLWLGMFIGHNPAGGPLMQAAARSEEIAKAVPYAVFVQSVSGVFWICTGLAVLALVLSLRFPNRVTPAQVAE